MASYRDQARAQRDALIRDRRAALVINAERSQVDPTEEPVFLRAESRKDDQTEGREGGLGGPIGVCASVERMHLEAWSTSSRELEVGHQPIQQIVATLAVDGDAPAAARLVDERLAGSLALLRQSQDVLHAAILVEAAARAKYSSLRSMAAGLSSSEAISTSVPPIIGGFVLLPPAVSKNTMRTPAPVPRRLIRKLGI